MAHSITNDDRGAVPIILALALVPMFGAIGGSIDYSRASAARISLQATVDAAALAAIAKTGSAERLAHARALVKDGERTLPHQTYLTAVEVSEDAMGTRQVPGIRVQARGVVPSTFMTIFGMKGIDITAAATSVGSKAVEVVLVIDVTGSMLGPRIEALRKSSRAFVNTLLADHVDKTGLSVSIVPYTASVNIGRARGDWLEPLSGVSGGSRYGNRYIWTEVKQEDCLGTNVTWNAELQACHIGQLSVWDEKGGPCPGIKDKNICYVSDGWSGCVEERGRGGDDMTDVPPTQKRFRPYYWASWGGVANLDPSMDYNSYLPRSVDESRKTNAAGNNGRGPNLGCPQHPIVSWTNDRHALLAQVDQIEPWHRGGTMGHVGLAWGWRMISPRWRGLWGSPDLPRDYDASRTEKIVVFMTDGENWFYGDLGPSGDSDYTAYGRLSEVSNVTMANAQSFLDDKMLAVCDGMKKVGIEIFAVGLGLGTNAAGLQAKRVLSRCATSTTRHYFDSEPSVLVEHFSRIATDIVTRRIHIAR